MSDSDYLKPSERPWPEIAGAGRMLWRSHAAADDVMRELAEALHVAQHRAWELSLRVADEFEACAEADTGADCTELDESGCYGCAARALYAEILGEHHAGNAALARYDRMTGGDA